MVLTMQRCARMERACPLNASLAIEAPNAGFFLYFIFNVGHDIAALSASRSVPILPVQRMAKVEGPHYGTLCILIFSMPTSIHAPSAKKSNTRHV